MIELASGRRIQGSAAVAALVALLVGVEAKAQISVSPVIMQLPVEAEVVDGTISVSNAGTAQLSVRFYVGDFEQDEAGDNSFGEIGSFGSSCGDRIRVHPDAASLLPGETQRVRVEIEPGAESCWSAVFFETVDVTLDGTLVRQRIAAKVYGFRADARVEGEVTRVSTEATGSGRKLVLNFRNTGEAPLRPEGVLEIRSFAGEVVATAEIKAFSVLPGRDRSLEMPIPTLPGAGEYIAVPVLDFGGAYLTGGQVVFEVGGSPVAQASSGR